MKKLDKNWLTSGLIDFEYKKYVLLAYLQEVKENFERIRLYPYLSDLVFHYQNLVSLKNDKELLFENFPKEISRADFEKLSLQYKKLINDDALMSEMEEIIFYAIPQVKNLLDEGKNIYEHVEENVEISPVGITPLRFDEGYLFICERHEQETQVYMYQITIFENANETFRAIHTHFLETVIKGFGKTFESLKIDVIQKYKQLPNPATYLIYSKLNFPMDETLLPIAKRLLVKHVNNTSL
ncbi:MAG: hypothetical protein HC880_13515 [Bacteroidia bacterium]|nr:hypothetical protein [Bacteroidia bacterium]